MLHDVSHLPANAWPPDGLVAALAASPIAFHLTGSRFMGHVHATSDWDFLAQDAPETRAALEALGFATAVTAAARQGLSAVGGPRVAAIYQRVAAGVKVQVQLARDLAIMCTVRDIIRHHVPAHAEFDYAQRKYVWDTLAAIVQMSPNGHERLPMPADDPGLA